MYISVFFTVRECVLICSTFCLITAHFHPTTKWINKYKNLKQSSDGWGGRGLILVYFSILCRRSILLLILLTPSLSPVGTGHSATAHYHSPPVSKLHSSLQPCWASKRACVSVCDTQRGSRDESVKQWEEKPRKKSKGVQRRGRETPNTAKGRADWQKEKRRGQGREKKCYVDVLSLKS